MADNVESLILEQFRRLDKRLENIENDMGDIKLCVNAVEDHTAALVMSVAGINHRLDSIEERFGRVERRLDLTDVK